MLCMGLTTARGANVVREARNTIKNARYEENEGEAKKVRERLEAAEKSLMDALPGEGRAVRRAELYYTAALVQCRLNDIENEKVYLKRGYDTTLYYNSIYNAYKYFERCDSVESCAENEGKCKFRPSVRKGLLKHRANLLNGGRFYLGKKDYAEAFRFLDLYLSSAGYPAVRSDFLDQTDAMYPRAAHWIVAAGYRVGDYGGVVRYASEAMRYPKNRRYVQEYLCRSLLALNDTASWVRELRRGVACFPDHAYFFTALQKFLGRKGRYDEALEYADRMVKYDPKNALFWHARAWAHMRKKEYKKCIADCDVILTLDSMNVAANYFKGLAFCTLAGEASEAMGKADLKSDAYGKHKEDMAACYAMAEEPLERVRRLSPEKVSRWAPLLYQVYLNLNKGAEFDEMERIMRGMKQPGTE